MNEEAFLSALRESPGDEVTWLALADWLDEDGQPQRAELVRIGRALRKLPVMKRGRKRAALEDRLIALLASGVRPVVPEVVNRVGMRLALIPPGRSRMGSPATEKGRDRNEGREHEVEIPRPFYLGVFPVTQRQYQKVMGNNPAYYQRGREVVGGLDTRDFPVETVSWDDAVGFCAKLSALAEEKQAGRVYRLPTEAEWEHACRAGTTTATHFGDSISSLQANFLGHQPYGGAGEGPALHRPCPVDSYPPNAFGLHDMHGNIWEWCSDYWRRSYPPAKRRRDPAGPKSGHERVTRAGCYFNAGNCCRSAARCQGSPEWRGNGIGFRVALDVPVAPSLS